MDPRCVGKVKQRWNWSGVSGSSALARGAGSGGISAMKTTNGDDGGDDADDVGVVARLLKLTSLNVTRQQRLRTGLSVINPQLRRRGHEGRNRFGTAAPGDLEIWVVMACSTRKQNRLAGWF